MSNSLNGYKFMGDEVNGGAKNVIVNHNET